MSDLIDQLVNLDVFVHTEIPIHEIPYLYMPFRELSAIKVEDDMRKSLDNSSLAMLEGLRGSGKSCASYFVLLNALDAYFPIVITPILEDVNVVCASIEEFVRLVLQQLTSNISLLPALDKALIERAKDMLAMKVSFTQGKQAGLTAAVRGLLSILPGILSVEPSVGVDVKKYSEKSLEQKAFNTQRIQCIKELCETIESYKRKPAFYVDDTDKFLRRPGLDWSKLIPKFFGHIVPALAKIDRPVIIAAHTYYRRFSAYKETIKNIVDDRIEIPVINDAAIRSVVDRRINAASSSHTWQDVFEQDAMNAICSHYAEQKTLRQLMGLCRECIHKAQNEGLQKVPLSLVNAAKAYQEV